jgi:hypothetical protein
VSTTLVNRLPELADLERIIGSLGQRARVETVAHVQAGEILFPLYTIELGSTDPSAPCLAIFGGVHGLERIGTQVVLSYLKTVSEFLSWDHAIQELLSRSRLLFVPLVNPGGMYLKSRANPSGVDLMRNAPIHAEKMSSLALFAGHRISPRLPWYRGAAGAPMEAESQAVCDFVRKKVLPAKISLALDCHSGFGSIDRIWFPYARTRKPFPHITEVLALKELLDKTYPNHIYVVEPQSKQYMAHGDLWDYLYDENRRSEGHNFFLPLTLELGSWLWARKNWKQLFSIQGAFNPTIPHRLSRTLRRHLLFFDFLLRAVTSSEPWLNLPKEQRGPLTRRALELWYGS